MIRLLRTVFSPAELGPVLTFADDTIGLEYDGTSLGIACQDSESGPLTLNLGLVKQTETEASLGIDIRYPVTADGEKLAETILGRAKEAGIAAAVNSLSVPLFLPEENPLIRLLKRSYQAVTGEEALLYSTGGGTYARSLHSRGVAFGPVFPEEGDRRLHNSNENIDIAYFMKHAQICLEAMYQMLTAD